MKFKRFEASDQSIPVEHIFGSPLALNILLVWKNCLWYGYYYRHKTLLLLKRYIETSTNISLNTVFI